MTRSASGRGTVAGGLLAALVAGLLALAPATTASAHDYLVDSTPKAGSVQTQPLDSVTLTFNDIILDLKGNGSGALMQVTGPDARHYETGCATVLDRVLSVPVSLGAGGKYLVTWQIVSADGHTVSSSIEFTYRPPAGTVASAGNAVGPPCGQLETAAPGASTGSGTGGGSTAQTSDLGIVLGIAIGIVVLALAGVLIVVLTARRRPRGE
ncbi:copper resistance protein CopC [Diaminobutyricibacter tongyongensis]|uniref:Copper resistance protein CopC n=1 Tax=Leifsonia tongyongensis TaxID=1268043 RepID=A0A6L9XW22_9MICO|nr:copper resistance CopC family protein [Diaminobutyricibacter tongyongensis]NEN05496.1 copper resistance protein CopC [Diaminobutyricibacter tongyongensis]